MVDSCNERRDSAAAASEVQPVTVKSQRVEDIKGGKLVHGFVCWEWRGIIYPFPVDPLAFGDDDDDSESDVTAGGAEAQASDPFEQRIRISPVVHEKIISEEKDSRKDLGRVQIRMKTAVEESVTNDGPTDEDFEVG